MGNVRDVTEAIAIHREAYQQGYRAGLARALDIAKAHQTAATIEHEIGRVLAAAGEEKPQPQVLSFGSVRLGAGAVYTAEEERREEEPHADR